MRHRFDLGGLFGSAEGAIGVVFTAIVVLLAVFGRFLAPYPPDATDLAATLKGPSSQHWFGTDEVGRDLLSRVLAGASYTVPAAMSVVLFGLVFGAIVGAVAGYFGGWLGDAMMRITDLFLSYPSLLLAIAVSAALGQGLIQASAALSVIVWAGYARLAYVQTVSVRGRLYMDAAEIAGTSVSRRLFRHLLPNAAPPLLIKATMDVAFGVEWIASLGFIGLGAREPVPEWGAMIATSRQYALTAEWYVIFPSLALLITILGFVLLGSALEVRLSGRGSLSRAALRGLATPDGSVPAGRAATATPSLHDADASLREYQ